MRSRGDKRKRRSLYSTGLYLGSTIFCHLIFNDILSLASGQQPLNNLYQKASEETTGAVQSGVTTKLAGSRIGTAPHDRLACQLSPSQRRHPHHHHQSSLLPGSVADDLSAPLVHQNANQTRFALPAGGSGSASVHPDARAAASNKRFDSSERLRQLRQLLASNSYDAYLVTPNDEHGSEYTSEYDRRLRFISGFAGSNGFALILLDRAVLFTDGRYALQADQELDCNWWLVVNTDPLTDIPLWLKENAANGLKIATDARLMSLQSFDYLEEQIRKQDSEFALISQDLIDVVWNSNVSEPPRPRPEDTLFVHPLQFAGNVSWQEKVVRLSDSMNKLGARHYIVSQLDDIAWLLNLRGNDIPMMPLFKAYLLISRSETTTTPVRVSPGGSAAELLTTAYSGAPAAMPALQTPQMLQVQPSQSIKVILYVDLKKIDQQVRDHLHVDSNGTTVVRHQLRATRGSNDLAQGDAALATTRIQVELRDYEVFIMDIRDKLQPTVGGGGPAAQAKPLQGRLLLNAGANVAIHVLAKSFDDRLVLVESLINKLKAVKSDGEVQGMRAAHWRDSLAISMLLAQLDADIGARNLTQKWTEVSAARELEFYRSLMDHNKGESFPTISAYGSNGAIVHYQPDQADPAPRPIGNQSTYLLDCGGQYLDGTTDITRTLHYGEPTEFQRETYTRVLMGAVDMMSLIFDQASKNAPAYRLNDLLARRHLFELGLDYAHGTGHGIGLYSMVHEAPWLIENYATGTNAKRQQVAGSGKQPANLVHSEPIALQANMFTSVEPGYYKANEFGIRLENIVVTQLAAPPAGSARPNDRQEGGRVSANERQFLRFEPLSLVPFEPKLIKFELLSNKQKTWLNSYNMMVRFRMTKQINHYLNKILAQPKSTQPVQVTGEATASRLYQVQMKQQQQQQYTANQTKDDVGRFNFLRLDGALLKDKLEKTHRWILSKTELIPLDVSQALVGSTNPVSREQTSNNFDLERLKLLYMAGSPFNNPQAGEAVAALGEPLLGGRMGSAKPAAGSSATNLAEGNKCSGFECDLWLLSSLNQASSSASTREQRQTPHGSTPSSSPWASLWPEDDGEPAADSGAGNLWRLFQLNGSGSYPALPINMWSLVVLGLLVVLQLGIVSFMCRQKRFGASLSQAPPSSAAVAR